MAEPKLAVKPLPRWLIGVASVGVVLHLLAVLAVVLAAQSGPWPSPFGPSSPQEPPPFVWQRNSGGRVVNELATKYLQLFDLAHDYHFASNRVDFSAVKFDLRLKDSDSTTLSFPEEGANFWVRHRQRLLAQNLGDDQPVSSNRQNTLTKGEIERVQVWEPSKGGRELTLKSLPVTNLRRDQPANGPSPWSQLIAKSYVRYILRKHEAEAADLIRRSRDPVPPFVLVTEPEFWPPNLFSEMVADFTER